MSARRPVDSGDKNILTWLGFQRLCTNIVASFALGRPMSVTKQQILQLLRAAPEGLSSNELAARLGAASYDARARLSKLAAYGEIEKINNPSPPGKTKWRLKHARSHR